QSSKQWQVRLKATVVFFWLNGFCTVSCVYNLFFNCHMELAITIILLCATTSHGSFHLVVFKCFILRQKEFAS
ncbi:MAG: hypothetical protein PHS84_14630, partial [Paludibacter sp.]|nr:hypothetical protein [Paludibacter sp.]